MKTDEIRKTYLDFFVERGHELVPSASLVPASHDPSVLLTTAGMQPFKPYFLGREEPPSPRLCSVQRCFRTTDIEQVGNTARHLTCFEMLGNWSFGDYFKEETIPWGWELSVEGFGFDPERVWVTVFEGDDELGLGPDEEAIEIWRRVGVPDERIVALPRSENFWQAGPTGPCGPCSEMYLDRGEEFGGPDERPGGEGDRFLEYWNHVFMSYELAADGSVTELPTRNIDTGMGLERMAAILQDVPSVFETDAFSPLVGLAEELSGRSYGDDAATTRAMRIIADHCRGTAFLIADGVVPSNEERGYVLRRIMRRAIQQGRVLGLEPPYVGRFTERAVEMLGDAYPVLREESETIARWVRDEEESFGHTLDRGSDMLADLIAAAKRSKESEIDAADVFRLHDTFGFPYDLTRELLADEGLGVDDAGFQELMEAQRERARAGGTANSGGAAAEAVASFADTAPPSRFVGYEKLEAETNVTAVRGENGRALVKLEESPFYAEGGGQVADSGRLSWDGGGARVAAVHRVGEDQAVEIEPADEAAQWPPPEGARVTAAVEPAARHATMCNHTATHLLHAALRERLGDHVRQAGSAVRPDKLRFDFTHGASLSPDDVAAIERRVNGWIKDANPVRALQMSLADARELGAMALFGEKYGDWVRVVEVAGVSRELCGGTHVANTSEIGIFRISAEGSSAANVRRIEALTGPAAIDWFIESAERLQRVSEVLGGSDPVAAAEAAAERVAEHKKQQKKAGAEGVGRRAEELAGSGEVLGGVRVIVAREDGSADQKQLLMLADQAMNKAGDAAVVVGGADGGKVGLVGSFSEAAVAAGLSAAAIVGDAAKITGGGGGGRDNVAQAGGRDPERLDEALDSAQQAIEAVLGR